MTEKEDLEYMRLSKLWVTKKATRKQMMRCLALKRKDDAARKLCADAAKRGAFFGSIAG